MTVAAHHARRRLARTREHVTLRTQTRTTTVDPSTGQHTWTDTAVAQHIPAIIYDTTRTDARNTSEQRDINIKQITVKVEAHVPVVLGQRVEFVDCDDPQLENVAGSVTTIGRSGRMFRSFTVTTERTP